MRVMTDSAICKSITFFAYVDAREVQESLPTFDSVRKLMPAHRYGVKNPLANEHPGCAASKRQGANHEQRTAPQE